MNDTLDSQLTQNAKESEHRLAFLKHLQMVTNRIHATSDIDELMLELSEDVCGLFNAERLTIYAVGEDKASIVSKVKTGLSTQKNLRLPISAQSIAGHVALSRSVLNIHDVYDDAELKSISPDLRFLKEVDKRTGYRTKQMLVAPVIDLPSNELFGVVQILNTKDGKPFSEVALEGIKSLSETLAIAFSQRNKPVRLIKTKYDFLVADAVVSAEELESAQRTARRKNLDLEDVLTNEYQVKLSNLGAALSKYFGVPYEPFRGDRIKPIDLLKNLKFDYLQQNQWAPVEESAEGIVIICTDPEQIMGARVVKNIFPRAKITYRVTSHHEFRQTLDQLFGNSGVPGFTDDSSVGDMLATLDQDELEADGGLEISASADNELVKLVNKIIIDAYQQGASDIHIEPGLGKDKVLVRFRKDGTLVKYVEVPSSYRSAMVARLKIMCDLDIAERRKPQD
jgi:hypothetical protein